MFKSNYLKSLYNLMFLLRNESENDVVDMDTVASTTDALIKLLEMKDDIFDISNDIDSNEDEENTEDDEENTDEEA